MNIAKNILVATDFSELGRAALDEAARLAEKLDAKLNVVSVFTQPNVVEAASMSRSERNQALDELRSKVAELEAQLRSSGRTASALVRLGDPAPTILSVADELDADLIVLGTHSRRGLTRLIMGSTAEAVLREAEVPVLIVKRANPAQVADALR